MLLSWVEKKSLKIYFLNTFSKLAQVAVLYVQFEATIKKIKKKHFIY